MQALLHDGKEARFITVGSICSICLEEILASNSSNEEGTSVRVPLTATNGDLINRLPCNHYFHGSCILSWLLTSTNNNNNCPLCRCNFPKEFPLVILLARLLKQLKYSVKWQHLEPFPHRFFLFKTVVSLLDQDPDYSGPDTKLFYARIMQEIDTFIAALFETMPSPRPIPRGTRHYFDSPCCAFCAGEIHYVSLNGESICPLCRLNMPKDVSVEYVLDKLIWVLELQNLELSWLIFQLFECLLYLLFQDQRNLLRAKPLFSRVIERFDAIIDGFD